MWPSTLSFFCWSHVSGCSSSSFVSLLSVISLYKYTMMYSSSWQVFKSIPVWRGVLIIRLTATNCQHLPQIKPPTEQGQNKINRLLQSRWREPPQMTLTCANSCRAGIETFFSVKSLIVNIFGFWAKLLYLLYSVIVSQKQPWQYINKWVHLF